MENELKDTLDCILRFDASKEESTDEQVAEYFRIIQGDLKRVLPQAVVSGMSSLIHHCGNELTEKEIEYDHCLKCSEYLSED